MKSCGDCTKCCDGSLGVPYPTEEKACLFMVNTGCSIYEDRPDFPCKSFKCEWLRDESMPEELKPNKTNIVLYPRTEDGIKYLELIKAGDEIDGAKSLVIEYAKDNKINIRIKHTKIGSDEFMNIDGHITDEAHN